MIPLPNDTCATAGPAVRVHIRRRLEVLERAALGLAEDAPERIMIVGAIEELRYLAGAFRVRAADVGLDQGLAGELERISREARP
jgi:hypothetical protein